MSEPAEGKPVKLACQGLWKTYGVSSPRFDGEAVATRRRLRDQGAILAVAGVHFEVHVGEIFVIMGLSGSGKSTLVRCLSRLVEPSAGHVLLDGQDLLQTSARELIELRRRSMGMVFQNFGLLPHLNVLDNVAFPLRIKGVPAKARQERAREVIQMVGLDQREHAFPDQLSGGQQQRVGIARSLAVDPGLWFLDEPFSALDPLIRRQMQDEFLRLQRMLHKTIVFITHDVLEAFRLADRIALMRDGEIIQIGTPAQIALQPADDYVASFTEDVPLAGIVRLQDMVSEEVITADPQSALAIPGETPLDRLIPKLAEGHRLFRPTDPRGGSVGLVTAAAVLDVLQGSDRRGRATP